MQSGEACCYDHYSVKKNTDSKKETAGRCNEHGEWRQKKRNEKKKKSKRFENVE